MTTASPPSEPGFYIRVSEMHGMLMQIRDQTRDNSTLLTAAIASNAAQDARLAALEARRWPLPLVSLVIAVLAFVWPLVMAPSKGQ
jgi:hypothetical protein